MTKADAVTEERAEGGGRSYAPGLLSDGWGWLWTVLWEILPEV